HPSPRRPLTPAPLHPFRDAWVHTDHNRASAVAAAVRAVAMVFLQPQPLQTTGAARACCDLRARGAGDDPGPGLEPRRSITVLRLFRARNAFAHSHAPLRGRPN